MQEAPRSGNRGSKLHSIVNKLTPTEASVGLHGLANNISQRHLSNGNSHTTNVVIDDDDEVICCDDDEVNIVAETKAPVHGGSGMPNGTSHNDVIALDDDSSPRPSDTPRSGGGMPTSFSNGHPNLHDSIIVAEDDDITVVIPKGGDASSKPTRAGTGSPPVSIIQDGTQTNGVPEMVSCTACGKKVNIQKKPQYFCRHTKLGVLMCKKCQKFVNTSKFSRDEMGIEEYCTWCGDGGKLVCCDFCEKAYCKNCVKRNMGKDFLKVLLNADDSMKWKCFACDLGQLKTFQDECDSVVSRSSHNRMNETAFQQQKVHLDGPSQIERLQRLKDMSELVSSSTAKPQKMQSSFPSSTSNTAATAAALPVKQERSAPQAARASQPQARVPQLQTRVPPQGRAHQQPHARAAGPQVAAAAVHAEYSRLLSAKPAHVEQNVPNVVLAAPGGTRPILPKGGGSIVLPKANQAAQYKVVSVSSNGQQRPSPPVQQIRVVTPTSNKFTGTTRVGSYGIASKMFPKDSVTVPVTTTQNLQTVLNQHATANVKNETSSPKLTRSPKKQKLLVVSSSDDSDTEIVLVTKSGKRKVIDRSLLKAAQAIIDKEAKPMAATTEVVKSTTSTLQKANKEAVHPVPTDEKAAVSTTIDDDSLLSDDEPLSSLKPSNKLVTPAEKSTPSKLSSFMRLSFNAENPAPPDPVSSDSDSAVAAKEEKRADVHPSDNDRGAIIHPSDDDSRLGMIVDDGEKPGPSGIRKKNKNQKRKATSRTRNSDSSDSSDAVDSASSGKPSSGRSRPSKQQKTFHSELAAADEDRPSDSELVSGDQLEAEQTAQADDDSSETVIRDDENSTQTTCSSEKLTRDSSKKNSLVEEVAMDMNEAADIACGEADSMGENEQVVESRESVDGETNKSVDQTKAIEARTIGESFTPCTDLETSTGDVAMDDEVAVLSSTQKDVKKDDVQNLVVGEGESEEIDQEEAISLLDDIEPALTQEGDDDDVSAVVVATDDVANDVETIADEVDDDEYQTNEVADDSEHQSDGDDAVAVLNKDEDNFSAHGKGKTSVKNVNENNDVVDDDDDDSLSDSDNKNKKKRNMSSSESSDESENETTKTKTKTMKVKTVEKGKNKSNGDDSTSEKKSLRKSKRTKKSSENEDASSSEDDVMESKRPTQSKKSDDVDDDDDDGDDDDDNDDDAKKSKKPVRKNKSSNKDEDDHGAKKTERKNKSANEDDSSSEDDAKAASKCKKKSEHDDDDGKSDSSIEERIVKKKSSRLKQRQKRRKKTDDTDDSDEDGSVAEVESSSSETELSEDGTKRKKIPKPKKVKRAKRGAKNQKTTKEITPRKRSPKKSGRKVVIEDSDAEDDDDEENTPSKRSERRNIRKILKDKDLTDETKRARELEDQRRKRLLERTKAEEAIGADVVLDEEEGDFVLERNSDKEVLVSVDAGINRHLKPHQRLGIQFVYDNIIETVKAFKKGDPGNGALLAHCMGLGKTLQVISIIHTLMNNENINLKTILVVAPLNTVLNWEQEFEKWLDHDQRMDVYVLSYAGNMKERVEMLTDWQRSGGVLIAGYEMYRNLANHNHVKQKKLKVEISRCLADPGPELVVCDEGHILRNASSAISKAMNMIKTKRRVVLTGTPLQNNLTEYHVMVDFIKPNLLGTLKEFQNRFINPIKNGQCSDSSGRDVRIMKHRCHVLYELLSGCVQRQDYSVLTPFLPPKREYTIQVRLSEKQKTMYQYYLDTFIQRVDGKVAGANLFSDFHCLSRIWSHPWGLQLEKVKRAQREAKKIDDFLDDEEDEEEEEESEEEEDKKKDSKEPWNADTDSDDDDDKKKRKRRKKHDSDDDSNNSGTDESDDEKSSKKKKKPDPKTGTSGRKTRNSLQTAGIDDEPPSMIARRSQRNTARGSGSDSDDTMTVHPSPEKLLGNTRSGRNFKDGDENSDAEDAFALDNLEKEWYDEFLTQDDQMEVANSGKLVLLLEILADAEVVGDKLLVFSQSLISLDLIEQFLGGGEIGGNVQNWCHGVDYFRMDGSTPVHRRKQWSDVFNDPENTKCRLFLISTRAGSLGINMVGANRVIVFDCSWNPSHDVQSVFRVYRFGQEKPCYIYRFIAQGTMEEKVYGRQITKLSVAGRVVDEQQIERHFSSEEMRELYTFAPDAWKEGEERETPALPKDPLLAEVLQRQHPKWIVRYHEHDILLENVEEEEMTEEEKKQAWESYTSEKDAAARGIEMGSAPVRSYNYRDMAQAGDGRWPAMNEADHRAAMIQLEQEMAAAQQRNYHQQAPPAQSQQTYHFNSGGGQFQMQAGAGGASGSSRDQPVRLHLKLPPHIPVHDQARVNAYIQERQGDIMRHLQLEQESRARQLANFAAMYGSNQGNNQGNNQGRYQDGRLGGHARPSQGPKPVVDLTSPQTKP